MSEIKRDMTSLGTEPTDDKTIVSLLSHVGGITDGQCSIICEIRIFLKYTQVTGQIIIFFATHIFFILI